MFIYKITNLINGKSYIGQTKNPIKKRWQQHCWKTSNPKKCTLIKNAIFKYGKENFEISEICKAETIEELNDLEKYYIIKYNTLNPNGYNMEKGGRGYIHKGYNIDISTIRKKIWKNPEYKEKMSKLSQKQFETKESRIKMSISRGGRSFEVYKILEYYKKYDHSKRTVSKTEYIGTWQNQRECAKDLNLNYKSINECLNKKCNSNKGYIFKFKELS